MKKTAKGMLRTLATRSVIAAIPVAMVSAYASNAVIPTPPRMAQYAYQQVAEITVSPDTVGIAASPLYGQTKQQIDAQLDQLQALGVENIRVFVPWALLELQGPTQPGSASWSTLDLVMQAAKERNMGVMAEINSTPPYAVTAGGVGTGTPDPADFAAFMTKFATAYGSEVSAYEIWNEPNAVLFSNPIDPAAYAALVKAAYNAIKPIDPTATIVAGAVGHVFSTGATMDPVDFVKAMIAADPTIGNYFDALSYHPYDETLPFSQGNVDPNSSFFASDTAYNQVKDLMALFPDKKVWLSEFGVPTYSYTDANGVVHTVTQAQQAALIQDLIQTWGTLNQAGPIFLYTGRDTNTGDGVAEDNYGLYDENGNPKSVIAYLTQYFLTHPQNSTGPTDPGGPTNPGNPADALAAALQVIAQQIAAALSQAVSQAFATAAQALGQQIATAIVTAIANALAGLGQPQAVTPTAAPLALRTAAVVAKESSTPTATSTPSSDPSTPMGDTPTAGAETASSPDTTPAATPATDSAAATLAATPATTPTAAPAVEAAATPAAVIEPTPTASTPEATALASTAPASTAPASTTPASTAPEPTKPTPSSAPSSTAGTSTDAGTPAAGKDKPADGDGGGSTPKGGSDKSGSDKSGADKSGAPKSGQDKSGADKAVADKSGDRTADSTSRHWKGKGGNDVGGNDGKPKTETGSSGTATASAKQGTA
jgi:hypothetical protein